MGSRSGLAAGVVAMAWAGCLAAPPAAVGPDAATALSVSRESDLPISDDWPPTVDSLEVEPRCRIEVVTIDVDIDHTFRGDLELTLEAPIGLEVLLTEFDGADGADDLIGNFPQDFAPLESLDRFGGLEARGTWTFTVDDEGPNDSGKLNRWGLNLGCADSVEQPAR